ncbi:carbohydrate-binding protein [Actinomadura sp. LD22]|uniref:Carbohydrate-binding protein n=1 Tax=Actinomadura physcomitrii TaxID=2650748 RepID=A0A6I4MCV1_9ACTN|nr:carbohydrate-binding protein [Actinomadura physcomitrii]MVZ99965.1 carbohydrate-binding protein [Actinomadura physcomitrii]
MSKRFDTHATLTVPSTGDRYAYKDVTAALHATGRHDLYLVFTGEARLSALTRPVTSTAPSRSGRDGAAARRSALWVRGCHERS